MAITTTPPGSPAPSIPSPSKDHILRFSPDPTSGPGGFPYFSDGDVLILSGAGKNWKLHSVHLRNASKKFRALLDEHEPRHLTKAMREEGKTVKWRIEMVPWDMKPEDMRFRSFRVQEQKSKSSFNLANIIGGDGGQFLSIYDNFFRSVYQLPPILTTEKEGIGAFFILDAISLLQAAECLEAAKAVRLVVEAHLLRLNQVLWLHIQRNPEAWSDIAVRLQSPIIFREAMVHIVGKFDLPKGVRMDFLKEQENGMIVLDLAHTKYKELRDMKLMVERNLLDHFPQRMIHSETATDVPGRQIYANDVYLWQALTIVRQWISSSYMMNLHHRSTDGGVALYRSIGAGGDAYLRKDTLDCFHRTFGMSTKGKQCLQVAVEIVKDELCELVEELLVDRTQQNRDPYDPKLNYLTCTEVLDEELPWNVAAAEEAKAAAAKAAKAAKKAAAEEAADRELDHRMDGMGV